jgi:ribosomal protein S21
MIQIEVKRAAGESTSNLLRRFSKRVQSSGILRKVKSKRYAIRTQSDLKIRRSALKRLEKIAIIERLRKLGKMKDAYNK